MIAKSGEHGLPASGCRKHLDKRLREWNEVSRQAARDGHAGSVCSPEPTNSTAPQSVALRLTSRAIALRAITMCRHSISAARRCMRFHPTVRRSRAKNMSHSSTSAMCVDREVAWLLPYCRNLTVTSFEQVIVPASHTLYV